MAKTFRHSAPSSFAGLQPALQPIRGNMAAEGLVAITDVDALSYDQWLLPPEPLSSLEAAVQRFSSVMGPVLLVAASAAIFFLIAIS